MTARASSRRSARARRGRGRSAAGWKRESRTCPRAGVGGSARADGEGRLELVDGDGAGSGVEPAQLAADRGVQLERSGLPGESHVGAAAPDAGGGQGRGHRQAGVPAAARSCHSPVNIGPNVIAAGGVPPAVRPTRSCVYSVDARLMLIALWPTSPSLPTERRIAWPGRRVKSPAPRPNACAWAGEYCPRALEEASTPHDHVPARSVYTSPVVPPQPVPSTGVW